MTKHRASTERKMLDPLWVVNDLGELGVKIGRTFYFLYKGHSIIYRSAKHDDGRPMKWRIVGKREFGETCQPLPRFRDKWDDLYQETLVFTPGLSDGTPSDGAWKRLPGSRHPDSV